MTLSGIWDLYFYDASHTIRELLSVYPYATALPVCQTTLIFTTNRLFHQHDKDLFVFQHYKDMKDF